MKDIFTTYHPIINFLFFLGVIGTSMFITHPIYMAISFSAAFVYAVYQQGWKKTLKVNILFSLPMMILVAAINPMFNHYGVTILFYLNNGNPITLESMVYGVVMAGMLSEVVMWFSCYNKVMTSDKFIYLFGRVIPGLSLILSMCMRFVPKFINQAKVISNGQKCIGRDVTNGNVLKRAKNGITILSILVTWALENAIDTSDSMKARGYGLKGRSAFSIFSFDRRDKLLLIIEVLMLGGIGIGVAQGFSFSRYNPRIVIGGMPATLESIICYIIFALFCYLPVILNIVENMKWIQIRREINNHTKDVGGYRTWEY